MNNSYLECPCSAVLVSYKEPAGFAEVKQHAIRWVTERLTDVRYLTVLGGSRKQWPAQI